MQKLANLLGRAAERRVHQNRAAEGSREPLGHGRSRLDEELGAESGEGARRSCPQSASSPGVEFGCPFVRPVRSSRIPCSNEISRLTLRALR